MMWKIIEEIFKKPIEEIIDIATGEFKKNCGLCKEKQKYFSKEAIKKALEEKNRILNKKQ